MLTDRANTICLFFVLAKHSDEKHILSVKDICEYLNKDYQLQPERRTIYNSVETLRNIGIDVSTYEENKKGYFLRQRLLSVADVRLICDALYSLDSISAHQTDELVKKLQLLLSEHSRERYSHLTVTQIKRKTDNNSVFNNIALLEKAINDKNKISFVYMRYMLDKRLHPRRKELYIVSPYGMVCENGKYYLLCIKDGKEGISHYRIDLMNNVSILASKVEQHLSDIDLVSAKSAVYAFSGMPEKIVLHCSNSMIGGFIDRFGTEPKIKKLDKERFEAVIFAVPQGVLFWTMQYLNEVEIVSPYTLREQAIKMISENKYGI